MRDILWDIFAKSMANILKDYGIFWAKTMVYIGLDYRLFYGIYLAKIYDILAKTIGYIMEYIG